MPMRMTKRAFIVLAAVLLVAGAIPALAQDPARAPRQDPGAARAQQEAASVARGQLVNVDTRSKTIVIRTEPGPQMQFSYTDDTRVTGADQGIAGLATMSGTPVTVHFTKKDQTNVATAIEVQKKS
jgi:hypothetical protein